MDIDAAHAAVGSAGRDRRWKFGHDARAARRARGVVAEVLGSEPPAEDVRLVVSELVTNVVQHTDNGGVLHVVDGRPGGPIRIEVEDAVADVPTVPGARPGPGGQGLRIVERVAQRWGVDPTRHGKVVWAEFR